MKFPFWVFFGILCYKCNHTRQAPISGPSDISAMQWRLCLNFIFKDFEKAKTVNLIEEATVFNALIIYQNNSRSKFYGVQYLRKQCNLLFKKDNLHPSKTGKPRRFHWGYGVANSNPREEAKGRTDWMTSSFSSWCTEQVLYITLSTEGTAQISKVTTKTNMLADNCFLTNKFEKHKLCYNNLIIVLMCNNWQLLEKFNT